MPYMLSYLQHVAPGQWLEPETLQRGFGWAAKRNQNPLPKGTRGTVGDT
jgi:hypothetical protein